MSRRTYSATFIDDAVQMVRDGHPVNQVAKELGIPNGTLWNWVQAAGVTQREIHRSPDEPLSREQQELRDLRKRIADLEQENAFLGKVSAYFAGKHRP